MSFHQARCKSIHPSRMDIDLARFSFFSVEIVFSVENIIFCRLRIFLVGREFLTAREFLVSLLDVFWPKCKLFSGNKGTPD